MSSTTSLSEASNQGIDPNIEYNGHSKIFPMLAPERTGSFLDMYTQYAPTMSAGSDYPILSSYFAIVDNVSNTLVKISIRLDQEKGTVEKDVSLSGNLSQDTLDHLMQNPDGAFEERQRRAKKASKQRSESDEWSLTRRFLSSKLSAADTDVEKGEASSQVEEAVLRTMEEELKKLSQMTASRIRGGRYKGHPSKKAASKTALEDVPNLLARMAIVKEFRALVKTTEKEVLRVRRWERPKLKVESPEGDVKPLKSEPDS